MSNVKFGRLFKKVLNEAPVNLSDEDIGAPGATKAPGADIGLPPTENPQLKRDLSSTNALTNAKPAIQERTLRQMEQWIASAGTLASEINSTEQNSWVNMINKAFPPDVADGLTKQLPKAATELDKIKNLLSAAVNTARAPQQPAENQSL